MAVPLMRPGVIHNAKAHVNKRRTPPPYPGALFAEPDSQDDLAAALKDFHAQGVDLLVLDGGDGTVRDVISLLPGIWGEDVPLLSVAPSGKTNVLAFDLGIRDSWTVPVVLAAAAQEGFRVRTRAPLEVARADGELHRGFFFGAAGFVRARELAQGLHRSGVFRNSAVGLALAEIVLELAVGADHGEWRAGDRLSMAVDGGAAREGARLVTVATTLERFPFALRPFGPARHGLKFVDVDSPPKAFLAAVPGLLWGHSDRWLDKRGYRRGDAARLDINIDGSVVLDGEVFPGGELTVTEGAPLRFLTP